MSHRIAVALENGQVAALQSNQEIRVCVSGAASTMLAGALPELWRTGGFNWLPFENELTVSVESDREWESDQKADVLFDTTVREDRILWVGEQIKESDE